MVVVGLPKSSGAGGLKLLLLLGLHSALIAELELEPFIPSHIISKQALNIYIDTGITAFGLPVGFDFSCLDVELLRFGAATIRRTEVLKRIYPPIRDPSPEAKGIFVCC